jgi:hypothetical protein
MEKLTGQTPDMSIAMIFQFYDPVYYRLDSSTFPSDTTEKKGRFVGFAKDVGHALTYKVLTDKTRRILCRSLVRHAAEQPNRRLDPDVPLPPCPPFFRSKYEDILHEGSKELLPTIPSLHHDDVFTREDTSDDEDGESDDESPPPLFVRTVSDDEDEDDDDDDNMKYFLSRGIGLGFSVVPHGGNFYLNVLTYLSVSESIVDIDSHLCV